MKCPRCGTEDRQCPQTISGHCDWLAWTAVAIEECARVADGFGDKYYFMSAVDIAAAIRALKS